MPEALTWPPRKEDLERLYLVEKLSAAKIAKAYGLKYKNQKVGESTVLFQLKKNGIRRRDAVEHIRKVTEGMVDQWVARYQVGESLTRIAGEGFSPVTVFLHLRKRGLGLRDRVEAQIQAVSKHTKMSFKGEDNERAYMVGFAKGDCEVTWHGRAVRVRTSTTHPAMADLFAGLFGQYGFVHRYPRIGSLVGYEWSLEVDLDQSFKFLFQNLEAALVEYRRSPATLLSFLAGFFDAEGSIYFHRKGAGGGFELSLSNTNDRVLLRIQAVLSKLGYYSKFDTSEQKIDRLGYGLEGRISRLVIWRANDVSSLIRLLRLRHPEKVAKAEAAIAYHRSTTKNGRTSILKQHQTMKSATEEDVHQFVVAARRACALKDAEVTGESSVDREH